jgi:hypothetical protein
MGGPLRRLPCYSLRSWLVDLQDDAAGREVRSAGTKGLAIRIDRAVARPRPVIRYWLQIA